MGYLIAVLIIIFIVKLLINNLILNEKYGVSYFVFSILLWQDFAMEFGIRCLYSFYWVKKEKDTENTFILKRISNFLSLVLLIIFTLILFFSEQEKNI